MKRLAVLLIIVLLAGCGSKGENNTNIVPVNGLLTDAKGQPLKKAVVTFVPTGPGYPAASAVTDDKGNFTPLCLDNKKGMVPGNYKVVVIPHLKTDPTIPTKFRDEGTTDLTVDVKEGNLTIALP